MEEFIIGTPLFRLSLYGQINHQRASHDVAPGYEPPIAAVRALLAIIAQDKIGLRRDHQLAMFDMELCFGTPVTINITRPICLLRKVVAISVIVSSRVDRVALLKGRAVHVNDFVLQANVIAWKSDDALHQ